MFGSERRETIPTPQGNFVVEKPKLEGRNPQLDTVDMEYATISDNVDRYRRVIGREIDGISAYTTPAKLVSLRFAINGQNQVISFYSGNGDEVTDSMIGLQSMVGSVLANASKEPELKQLTEFAEFLNDAFGQDKKGYALIRNGHSLYASQCYRQYLANDGTIHHQIVISENTPVTKLEELTERMREQQKELREALNYRDKRAPVIVENLRNERLPALRDRFWGRVEGGRIVFDQNNYYQSMRLITLPVDDKNVITFYAGRYNFKGFRGAFSIKPTAQSERIARYQTMLQNILHDAYGGSDGKSTPQEISDLLEFLTNTYQPGPTCSESGQGFGLMSGKFAFQDYQRQVADGGRVEHVIMLDDDFPGFEHVGDLQDHLARREANLRSALTGTETYQGSNEKRRARKDANGDPEVLADFRQYSTSGRDDYIGEPEVVEVMDDIIGSLQHPEIYERAKLPVERKLLLAGPPGTGKTLFAKTIAYELGAKFYKPTYSRLGSEFQTASGHQMNAILDAIEHEAEKGPVVLLLDELDGIGESSHGFNSEADKKGRDALLTRIEDMNNPNLIIIGTTNKYEIIDPALVRPGRFGKTINVSGFRTEEVKEKALSVFMRQQAKGQKSEVGELFSSDIDLLSVIRRIPKSEVSGAELNYLVELAVQVRGRRVKSQIQSNGSYAEDLVTTEDLVAVIPKVFPSARGHVGF